MLCHFFVQWSFSLCFRKSVNLVFFSVRLCSEAIGSFLSIVITSFLSSSVTLVPTHVFLSMFFLIHCIWMTKNLKYESRRCWGGLRGTVAKKLARLPGKRKRVKYQSPIYCERERSLLGILNACREGRFFVVVVYLSSPKVSWQLDSLLLISNSLWLFWQRLET